MTDHIPPAPPVGPDSAAFYAAAKEGRFMVPRCTACGKAHWYPRPVCPFCFGAVELQPASGRGRIYSYSVMRRVSPPFAIAYVTLEEGPTMLTNLVGCDFDQLAIDAPVRLVFTPSADGTPVPCFTPEAAPGAAQSP